MFYQIYSGQKLAPDIMNLMNSHGFDILYINRVFSSSKDFNGLSRGQITFGEILFGLNREKALKLSTKKSPTKSKGMSTYLIRYVNGFAAVAI